MGDGSEHGLRDRSVVLRSGATLRYTIALPRSMTVARPVPLLLVLHYGGPVTPFYGRGLLEGLVIPALGGLGAVMVAPEARDADWVSEENEAAVLELLSGITAEYPVDPRRLVALGYSKGARGVWHLISRHPELFSAAVPIAGLPAAGPIGGRTPVFALHSRADALFPVAIIERVIADLAAGGRAARISCLEGVDHFDVRAFRAALGEVGGWLGALWPGTIPGA